MKTVLVTGATGFLGSHLVRRLVERGGAHVRALARRPSESLEGLDVEVVAGDVTGERDRFGDVAPLAGAFRGCEEVYHLAGFVSRDPRDGQEMMRVHVEGTKRVLAAAKEAGVRRVVVASSSPGPSAHSLAVGTSSPRSARHHPRTETSGRQ